MSPESKSLAETFYRDYRQALISFFMRRVEERSEAERSGAFQVVEVVASNSIRKKSV